ncbi:hypothetical protein [Streptomyces sp. NPDC048581]|uniref:hypothetical protein n=1 Tax=unclassified Streptomyces TaxID=2593676 RepID=UPI003723561A
MVLPLGRSSFPNSAGVVAVPARRDRNPAPTSGDGRIMAVLGFLGRVPAGARAMSSVPYSGLDR